MFEKTLLWQVLIQLWDKRPKYFSDQIVSAKMTTMFQQKKIVSDRSIKCSNTTVNLMLKNKLIIENVVWNLMSIVLGYTQITEI